MNGDEIVLHLAVALAEERARHAQTRASLSKELEGARKSLEVMERHAKEQGDTIEDLRGQVAALLDDDDNYD